MIHRQDQYEGIFWQGIGFVLIWFQSHGMAILGAASLVFSALLQYGTYKLRLRELEMKERESQGRMAQCDAGLERVEMHSSDQVHILIPGAEIEQPR